jgi:hypothetical protein
MQKKFAETLNILFALFIWIGLPYILGVEVLYCFTWIASLVAFLFINELIEEKWN